MVRNRRWISPKAFAVPLIDFRHNGKGLTGVSKAGKYRHKNPEINMPLRLGIFGSTVPAASGEAH